MTFPARSVAPGAARRQRPGAGVPPRAPHRGHGDRRAARRWSKANGRMSGTANRSWISPASNAPRCQSSVSAVIALAFAGQQQVRVPGDAAKPRAALRRQEGHGCQQRGGRDLRGQPPRRPVRRQRPWPGFGRPDRCGAMRVRPQRTQHDEGQRAQHREDNRPFEGPCPGTSGAGARQHGHEVGLHP